MLTVLKLFNSRIYSGHHTTVYIHVTVIRSVH